MRDDRSEQDDRGIAAGRAGRMEKTCRARDGQRAKRDPEADFRAGQGAVEQQQRANRPQDRKKLHLPGVTPGAFALTLAERDTQHTAKQKSEERRVGKEWFSTWRSRWAPYQ